MGGVEKPFLVSGMVVAKRNDVVEVRGSRNLRQGWPEWQNCKILSQDRTRGSTCAAEIIDVRGRRSVNLDSKLIPATSAPILVLTVKLPPQNGLQ